MFAANQNNGTLFPYIWLIKIACVAFIKAKKLTFVEVVG